MLRAVLKTQIRLAVDGAQTITFRTIDFENPEIEAALSAGGISEGTYELVDFVGVEIVRVIPDFEEIHMPEYKPGPSKGYG